MLFTFGIESSYNSQAQPAYVLDMRTEQLLLNKRYRTVRHAYKPHAQTRIAQNRSVVGQTNFELTMGNQGWSYLFGVLLGKRTRLSNKRFEVAESDLRVIAGQLTTNITTTATSFAIDEVVSDECDGTHNLIIGDELITNAVISSGSVTGAQRAQGGTTAKAHNAYSNVYLVSDQAGRNIDVCGPKQDAYGKSYLDQSMSVWVLRNEEYFCYSGMRIDQLEVNFAPETIVEAGISFTGADGTNLSPLTPITTYDGNPIVAGAEVKVLSLLEDMNVRRFYINLNNSFAKNTWGYDGIYRDLPMRFQNVYGQVTWLFNNIEHYESYIDNTQHNLSVQMMDWANRPPQAGIIINCNDLRVNTFAPQLTSSLVIQDSAPFYTYGESQVYLQF
jgi:hypothetical protein